MSQSHWEEGSGGNGKKTDPDQIIYDVVPLSCVPYTGPSSPKSNAVNNSSVTINQPAMVFIPSRPTDEEWNNIVAATKSGVALTGTAALGKVARPIGVMDIGECEDEYIFRVSLPGVMRDEKAFSCDVEPSGKIFIKGITTTGEKTVRRNSMLFEMQTQNLCPPGEFSFSFQLPGPIDHQQLNGIFGSDGIFEGVVKKRL
ncbi:hypothetical protein LIER_14550 [Lithospermum erythrorhizon]|uniref:SHSP domain-containing protein n=1 Tax=Lithospermum erythrorhizon TaxID=34254 RepID=A0AAV3PZZ7_LITER